jgi:NADPH:quinone reductase-like Zn-dependent oxidoreductase
MSLTGCRFDDDLKMIKRKGTIVSFGNASGQVEPVDLLKLAKKNVKLLRPTWVPCVFHTVCARLTRPCFVVLG